MIKMFCKFAIYIIVSGLLSHVIGYFIPRSYLNYNSFPYKSYKWEKNGEIYNLFHISKWKKKVPDMSKVFSFIYPKSIEYPPTSSQIDRLLRESCVAEIIHVLLIVVSPVILKIIRGTWGVFYFILSVLGNIPYIMIQRYNRPKCVRLYTSLCKKEQLRSSEELQKNESVNIIL